MHDNFRYQALNWRSGNVYFRFADLGAERDRAAGEPTVRDILRNGASLRQAGFAEAV